MTERINLAHPMWACRKEEMKTSWQAATMQPRPRASDKHWSAGLLVIGRSLVLPPKSLVLLPTWSLEGAWFSLQMSTINGAWFSDACVAESHVVANHSFAARRTRSGDKRAWCQPSKCLMFLVTLGLECEPLQMTNHVRTCSFIHSFMHSFIHFIHFIHSFISFIHSFIY